MKVEKQVSSQRWINQWNRESSSTLITGCFLMEYPGSLHSRSVVSYFSWWFYDVVGVWQEYDSRSGVKWVIKVPQSNCDKKCVEQEL